MGALKDTVAGLISGELTFEYIVWQALAYQSAQVVLRLEEGLMKVHGCQLYGMHGGRCIKKAQLFPVKTLRTFL